MKACIYLLMAALVTGGGLVTAADAGTTLAGQEAPATLLTTGSSANRNFHRPHSQHRHFSGHPYLRDRHFRDRHFRDRHLQDRHRYYPPRYRFGQEDPFPPGRRYEYYPYYRHYRYYPPASLSYCYRSGSVLICYGG